MSLFSKLTGDTLLDGAHAPQHNQTHVLVCPQFKIEDPCRGSTALPPNLGFFAGLPAVPPGFTSKDTCSLRLPRFSPPVLTNLWGLPSSLYSIHRPLGRANLTPDVQPSQSASSIHLPEMVCSELSTGFILDLSESTYNLGFPVGSVSKESAFNAGDLGSIPELGRCPGEGNGNPLQYSCLENSMDRGAWWLQSMDSKEADTT